MRLVVKAKRHAKTLLYTLAFVACVICYFLHDIRYCDWAEMRKLVTDKNGNQIPIYSDTTDVKSFGQLKRQCEYVGDKIVCPDVRHHGKSLMRQSHLALSRMHVIFDLICKRYNIDYWLYAGTLIGARRNGLFLSWDKDSDIAMKLDDFKKLLKYIRLDLPDDLYFQTGTDNPLLKRAADGKIRDRNSCYGTCLRQGCHWEDGLQIDIFVFHPVPNDPSKMESYFDPPVINIDDVYPTKDIDFEGVKLPGPKKVDTVLKVLFGPNVLSPPDKNRKQCSSSGSVAIPWYSCQHIKSLSKNKQTEILQMSMDHGNPYFWYILKFGL